MLEAFYSLSLAQAMNLHFKVKNYIADHLPEAIFDLIYLKKLTKD